MIVKVFAVYDDAAKSFMQPFFMHHAGLAIRSFTDTIADPSTQFHKHPEDFILFELGEYDDAKGSITCYAAPQSLGVALQFKEVE